LIIHLKADLTPMAAAVDAKAAEAAANTAVEVLSLAMVREYLHTRGYKKALATLGDELPVKPTPTTRTAMTKDLGLAVSMLLLIHIHTRWSPRCCC
jgi:hypothetical protein